MSSAEAALPVAAAVLVPVVTALAGVFALIFQDRRTRRSDSGRAQEALQRVAFVDQWWKARQAIDSPAELREEAAARALAWLEDASELFTTPRQEPDGVNLRRLLLLQPLQRRTAKVLRAGYYLFLCLMLLTTAAASATAADLEHNSTGDIVWSYLYAALFGLIAMTMRFFAVAAQNTPLVPLSGTSTAHGHKPH